MQRDKAVSMKKPEYYYNQSAVIPFIVKDGDIKITLITSRKKKRWIVPKGIIEDNMSPEDSAAKEAFEEAGVKGVVFKEALGSYKYEKWGGTCTVEVFPMKVEELLDDWLESDFRKRKVAPLKKAIELLDDKPLKKMIKKLAFII
jgi:8-oxo-dGTP pyrophosphatase MutT (NUDIX family)